MNPVILKPDKRYKPGHIEQKGRREIRGDPDTLEIKRLPGGDVQSQLNPPIIISNELGKLFKKMGVL